MSIQNIIDNATLVVVERTKLAGSTISRSGKYRTGFLPSVVPFVFTVTYRPVSNYSDVRGVLEEIDRLDIIYSESIDIGGTNPALSWITAYQGDLTSTQLGNITATTTYSASTITLDVSAVTGGSPSDVVFKAGDYFTLDSGYKYPYTVTSDVTLGSGSTISVPVNRPIIEQAGYTINTGKGILVGPDVTWTVKMLAKPTYQIMPDRFVEFTGEFTFVEVIED